MNRIVLLDPRALLFSSRFRYAIQTTCRTIFNGDDGSSVSPTSDLNSSRLIRDTTAELQDIAEYVREYRNFEIVDDHIYEDKDDAQTDSTKGKELVLESDVSYDHILSSLRSYLHACINANMLEKAHNTFIWYRYRLLKPKQEGKTPIDVSTYNLMLKAWANNGKTNKVKELFKLMTLADISPNMKSYSYYMLSLARQPQVDKEAVKKLVEEMDSKGFAIESLFSRTTLISEQRRCIEKMLREIYPRTKFRHDPLWDRSDTLLLKSYRGSHYPQRVAVCDVEDMKKWCAEQITHEKDGYVKVKRVYTEPVVESDVDYKKLWEKHEKEWRNALKQKIAQNLMIYKNRHLEFQGINIYPYLVTVDANDLTEIVIQHMTSLDCLTEHYSPPASLLHRILGSRVQTRYLTNVMVKNGVFADMNKVYNRYLEDLFRPHRYNTRQLLNRRAREMSITLESDYRDMLWPPAVLTAVGRFLHDIILNDLKVDANAFSKKESKKPVPVIFSYYKTEKLKVKEEVRPHPVFSRLQKAVCGSELIFDTNELPMVCPPFPWVSPIVGGFLIMPTTFVREFQTSSLKKVPVKQFVPVLDALNTLQLQPWIVNQPVLDVMIRVFQAKGDDKLDIPLHQSAFPPLPKRDSSLKPSERHELMKRIARMRRDKSEMFSLWCDCLYKLSIANHLRDRVFWLPHNLDFRGRVYSVPPHLQHLGGDLSRGLMLFAEGKPLGSEGLRWLKTHLINLTGMKKQSSIEERIAFANEMMPEILDSADRPLEGDRWWTQSDDPWQTLAVCKEIAAAVRSPDPEAYVSHFPVHQDGSCNGLQHYAALGRDQHGAESVNLVPFDKPQDVYNEVAKLVETERQNDAANGVTVAQILEGFVRRKVVKRTVMTYVYGVTRYGARMQILKELRNIDEFPKEMEWLASAYLMFQIFASIEKMFTATREIQDWLTECATLLSKNLAQPVKWTTPLGFPVTQPYFKQTAAQTPVSATEIRQTVRAVSLAPNSRKQRNGFPPNFIHSLDSTHMMLTALHCESRKQAFVSVHDCYWTHACDVDQMNRICRQQFVSLHSYPILASLAENFVTQYAPQLKEIAERSPETYAKMLQVLSRAPKRGTLRLDQVLDSVYFFS